MKLLNWRIPLTWNKPAYIIGGGFSLRLAAGAVDDINPYPAVSRLLAPIHNKNLIGINNAFMLGPYIDVVYWGDCSWGEMWLDELKQHPGLKITCCPKQNLYPKWVIQAHPQLILR